MSSLNSASALASASAPSLTIAPVAPSHSLHLSASLSDLLLLLAPLTPAPRRQAAAPPAPPAPVAPLPDTAPAPPPPAPATSALLRSTPRRRGSAETPGSSPLTASSSLLSSPAADAAAAAGTTTVSRAATLIAAAAVTAASNAASQRSLVSGGVASGRSRRRSGLVGPAAAASDTLDSSSTSSQPSASAAAAAGAAHGRSLPDVSAEAGDIALLGLVRFAAHLAHLSSIATSGAGAAALSTAVVNLSVSTADIAVLGQLLEVLHASMGYPLLNKAGLGGGVGIWDGISPSSSDESSAAHSVAPGPEQRFSVLGLPTLSGGVSLQANFAQLSLTTSQQSAPGSGFGASFGATGFGVPHVAAPASSSESADVASAAVPPRAMVSVASMAVLTSEGAGTPMVRTERVRRSSRANTAAELDRAYAANPSIFDANTREFVESIVAPKSASLGSARDKVRAVASVVGKMAVAARMFRSSSAHSIGGSPHFSPHSHFLGSSVGGLGGAGGHLLAFSHHSAGLEAAGEHEAPRPRSARVAGGHSLGGYGDSATERSTHASMHAHSPLSASSSRSSELQQGHDTLALRSAVAEETVLIGMDAWDWDICAANQALLSTLGLATGAASEEARQRSTQSQAHPVEDILFAIGNAASGVPSPSSASSAPHPVLPASLLAVGDSGRGPGAEMLVAVLSSSLEQLGAVELLALDAPTVASFAARIARGYQRGQPYHNALHAADVTQAAFHLLARGGLARFCGPEQQLALLLAAACHDVGHPGVNNAFLIASHHPLALAYNDISPLENMHAATAFLAMRRPNCDILAPLHPEQRALVRTLMVAAVLGTDNALHFKLMTLLKRRLARAMRPLADGRSDGSGGGGGQGGLNDGDGLDDDDDDDDLDAGGDGGGRGKFDPRSSAGSAEAVQQPLDMTKPSDAKLVLTTILHACDIANPSRPWHTSSKWSDWIVEEFFSQGDAMRHSSLAVPAMYDRAAVPASPTHRVQTQAAFITILVLPMWSLLAGPVFQRLVVVDDVVRSLTANLSSCVALLEEAKAANEEAKAAAAAAAVAKKE